jgi:hypothetical protein
MVGDCVTVSVKDCCTPGVAATVLTAFMMNVYVPGANWGDTADVVSIVMTDVLSVVPSRVTPAGTPVNVYVIGVVPVVVMLNDPTVPYKTFVYAALVKTGDVDVGVTVIVKFCVWEYKPLLAVILNV